MDSVLWHKEWFMNLAPTEKAAFLYLTSECDIAGVWSPNYELANFILGETIDWDALAEKCHKNIVVLDDGKWWLRDFCDFQYGELKPTCKPHAAVLKLLDQHSLTKGYPKGIDTLKDKDKDKDLDKDKDKIPGQALAIDWYKRYNTILVLTARPSETEVAAATDLLRRWDDQELMSAVLDYYFGNRTEWWAVTDGKRTYNFKAYCTNFPTIVADMRASPGGKIVTERLCPHCGYDMTGNTSEMCFGCHEEMG